MRRTGVGRPKHRPFRIHPERGKVTEDSVKAVSSETWDVLNDDVAGSKLANDTSELSPEAGAGIGQSGAVTLAAEALTREPAADEVNGLKVVCTCLSDIRHAPVCVGPGPRQHRP